MSADRKPQELVPVLAFPLAWLTRQVLRYPRAAALAALVLALLSGMASFQWLGFRTNRLDLLNPASEFHQRWLRYLDEFGRDDDLIVVIGGGDGERLAAAAHDLAAELAKHPEQFTAVIHERNLARVRAKALHQLELAQLRQLTRLVEAHRPILAGNWEETSPEQFPQQLIARLSAASRVAPASFAESGESEQLPAAIDVWSRQIEAVATGKTPPAAAGAELSELVVQFDDLLPQMLLLPDGCHAMVVLRLTQDDPQHPAVRAATIAKLREVLAQVARQHAPTTLGLTGMPVLEDDEMQASQQDMTWASVWSFLGVIVLLQLGFRDWRHTLLAIAILLFGMAWTFGFITLSIGHLNLLSVAFAAILIGLGIDFGIHYLARYLDLRHTGLRPRAALLRTATQIGPGVVTGAATTAVAFLCAAQTEFTGVAELGWIAGAGVLLCLLAAVVALPPLVWLLDERYVLQPRGMSVASRWWAKSLKWTYSRPGVLLVFLAAAGAASFGLNVLRYDHNLLHLQSDGLESVELERLLTAGGQRSIWFAVSIADDPAELRRRKTEFERLPSVARVEELASLVTVAAGPSAEQAERRHLIGQIHAVLTTLPRRVPLLPAPSADRLRHQVQQFVVAIDALPAAPTSLAAACNQLRRLVATLTRVSAPELSARLAAWRQETVERQFAGLVRLRELADPSPPTWDDLPAELVGRFRGRTGKHLLRVYAREDLWDLEPLAEFVDDVEFVDPQVTGHPVQTYYASRQIQRSYYHSGVYALMCVLIVVYLDFRHFGHALLALAPLVLTFLLTFGLAGWLGLPLNAANLLVLPLLLGIGIDNGVHVIHDWRGQTGSYTLTNSVALSMFLCSSTTIAGFCGLIFARHAGLRSLGMLLSLGMAICLATSLLFLPALLKLFERRRI